MLEEQPLVYESLAAALSKDDDDDGNDDKDILNADVVVMRRRRNKGRKVRPKSLSTIDGRKRRESTKSIEELLYPLRFSQQDLTLESPPERTAFRLSLAGAAVKPYTKKFDGLRATRVQNFTSHLIEKRDDGFVDPQVRELFFLSIILLFITYFSFYY